MALAQKERQQLQVLAIILAIAGAAVFWMYWRTPKEAQLAALQVKYDSLETRVEAAKKDLASGTVEALRRRVREYEANVRLMRQLVPSGAEVPSLIDDVSARAKRRNVQIAEITPLAPDAGQPFQTYKYRLGVVGHYDDVAEFLSDVATLRRIMVPYDVAIGLASQAAAKAYNDSTGSLTQTTFQLRTFVKQLTPADTAGGEPQP
ncbi:MAG: type 4a pilus biogenesis protein PilO [Micromonosporaceae bacterium]